MIGLSRVLGLLAFRRGAILTLQESSLKLVLLASLHMIYLIIELKRPV